MSEIQFQYDEYVSVYTNNVCDYILTVWCPDYIDFMNEQNAFLDSQPNEPASPLITPYEVYVAPSKF